MNPRILSVDQPVDALLRDWPAAASVFLAYHLACVGCCMAPFCALDEVIAICRLLRARFLADLQQHLSMPELQWEIADGNGSPDTRDTAPGD
jgi:hypothetical protein